MSEFCTSCGAQNSGSSFCTSCGASLAAVAPPSTSPNTNQSATEPPASISPSTDKAGLPQVKQVSTKKKVVIGGLILVLIAGISAGGFITGKASIDLKKERSVAYETGYQEGNLNGFTNGKESGYSDGYKDGCNFVFNKIGPDLIAIRSPWFTSNVYGYRWNKYEVC
jgi:hypothetical protein